MLRTGFVGLLLLTSVGAVNTVYLPIVSRQVPPIQTAPATSTATNTFVPVPTATSPATPTPTPTETSTPTPTATSTLQPPTATATSEPPTPTPTATTGAALYNCSADVYNCGSFNTQAEAQACFNYCYPIAGDIHKLDQDGDLIACESLHPLFELWNAP